jgi:hypothetical protein
MWEIFLHGHILTIMGGATTKLKLGLQKIAD